MRIKIAFLTVLALNALGFIGYGLFLFMRWEALWFQGKFLKEPEPWPATIAMQWIMLVAIGMLGYIAKEIIWGITKIIYFAIDELFPEKKS